jgi:hypothetical protein
LHDVAPATWPACRRVLAAVGEVADIPLTLLVVPAYRGRRATRDAHFAAAMQAHLQRGDELVLHGYSHVDEQPPAVPLSRPLEWAVRRIYTAGEGEFSALGFEAARERLLAGARWFAANHWPLAGFVPPAWLISRPARAALRSLPGFEYTTTLHQMIHLPSGAHYGAPSIVFSNRSALRRRLSVPWNHGIARAVARQPLVRFGLHPNDADDPVLRAAWQHLLAQLLLVREPATKCSALRALMAASGRSDDQDRDRRDARPDDAACRDVARIVQAERNA